MIVMNLKLLRLFLFALATIISSSLIAQYQVFWTDVSGLNYDANRNILTFDKSSDYGNAYSLNLLDSEGQENVSFRIQTDAYSTLGYVDTDGDYQHADYTSNMGEIEYGWHFENAKAEIYKRGSPLGVFSPISYLETDDFGISYVGGNIVFKHKGQVKYSVSYSPTSALLLEVVFSDNNTSFDPAFSDAKSPIQISYTTTEQNHEDGGSINATVIGGLSPYRYIWNSAPFIDKATYDLFAPTLHTELNKEENAHIASQFDLSKVPTYDEFVALRANPDVKNLMSGLYNLKVIDAEEGVVVKDISVSAATTWPQSSDYAFSAGQLQKTKAHIGLLNTPIITSDNVLYPTKDGRFGFKLSTNGEKVVGVRDGNVTATDYRNVQFGFYVDDTDIYLFKDGGVAGQSLQVINSNDALEVIRTGNTFSAKINGVEVGTYTDAHPEELKRWDVIMAETSELFTPDRVYCWWYIPLFAMEEEDAICGLKSSSITTDQEALIYNDYPYPVSFEWIDNIGNTNYPNSPTLNNVEPGWYKLVANVQHPTAPYAMIVGTYYIGYKVNWIQEVNLVNQPTTNSLELAAGGNTLSSVIGESNSSNTFNKPVDNNYGWIYTELPGLATGKPYAMEFSPYGNSGSIFGNGITVSNSAFYMGFAITNYGLKSLPIGNAPMEYGLSISPSVNYLVYTPNTVQEYLVSIHPAMIPVSYTGLTHFTADEGDKVVQLIDGSNYKLYINAALKATISIPSLSTANLLNIKGKVNVSYGTLILFTNGQSNYGYHDQILNCLTSFECRDQSYNLLAPELRAEFYNTINGNLYFQYQGEYNYGSLDYVIRDLDGNNVTTNVSISSGDKDYGDNRYILNMNKLSDGYYTLQVTNEKAEKYHLRIYKEY